MTDQSSQPGQPPQDPQRADVLTDWVEGTGREGDNHSGFPNAQVGQAGVHQVDTFAEYPPTPRSEYIRQTQPKMAPVPVKPYAAPRWKLPPMWTEGMVVAAVLLLVASALAIVWAFVEIRDSFNRSEVLRETGAANAVPYPTLILLALIPAVVIGLCVWAIDRWEREPIPLYLVALGWGAGFSIVMSLWGNRWWMEQMRNLVMDYGWDRETYEILTIAVGAGVVEEGAKGLGLLLIFYLFFKYVNGPVDGIVLGLLIGIGFAFTENVLYFAQATVLENLNEMGYDVGQNVPTLGDTFYLRGIITPFVHPLATALTGLFIGIASTRSNSRVVVLPLGLIGYGLGATLHGLHNFSSIRRFAEEPLERMMLQLPVYVGAVALILMTTRLQRRTTYRGLVEYAGAGWISWNEIAMVMNLGNRRRAKMWAGASVAERGGRAQDGTRAMRRFQHELIQLGYARKVNIDRRTAHKPDTRHKEAERLRLITKLRQVFAEIDESNAGLHPQAAGVQQYGAAVVAGVAGAGVAAGVDYGSGVGAGYGEGGGAVTGVGYGDAAAAAARYGDGLGSNAADAVAGQAPQDFDSQSAASAAEPGAQAGAGASAGAALTAGVAASLVARDGAVGPQQADANQQESDAAAWQSDASAGQKQGGAEGQEAYTGSGYVDGQGAFGGGRWGADGEQLQASGAEDYGARDYYGAGAREAGASESSQAEGADVALAVAAKSDDVAQGQWPEGREAEENHAEARQDGAVADQSAADGASGVTSWQNEDDWGGQQGGLGQSFDQWQAEAGHAPAREEAAADSQADEASKDDAGEAQALSGGEDLPDNTGADRADEAAGNLNQDSADEHVQAAGNSADLESVQEAAADGNVSDFGDAMHSTEPAQASDPEQPGDSDQFGDRDESGEAKQPAGANQPVDTVGVDQASEASQSGDEADSGDAEQLRAAMDALQEEASAPDGSGAATQVLDGFDHTSAPTEVFAKAPYQFGASHAARSAPAGQGDGGDGQPTEVFKRPEATQVFDRVSDIPPAGSSPAADQVPYAGGKAPNADGQGYEQAGQSYDYGGQDYGYGGQASYTDQNYGYAGQNYGYGGQVPNAGGQGYQQAEQSYGYGGQDYGYSDQQPYAADQQTVGGQWGWSGAYGPGQYEAGNYGQAGYNQYDQANYGQYGQNGQVGYNQYDQANYDQAGYNQYDQASYGQYSQAPADPNYPQAQGGPWPVGGSAYPAAGIADPANGSAYPPNGAPSPASGAPGPAQGLPDASAGSPSPDAAAPGASADAPAEAQGDSASRVSMWQRLSEEATQTWRSDRSDGTDVSAEAEAAGSEHNAGHEQPSQAQGQAEVQGSSQAQGYGGGEQHAEAQGADGQQAGQGAGEDSAKQPDGALRWQTLVREHPIFGRDGRLAQNHHGEARAAQDKPNEARPADASSDEGRLGEAGAAEPRPAQGLPETLEHEAATSEAADLEAAASEVSGHTDPAGANAPSGDDPSGGSREGQAASGRSEGSAS